MPSSGMQLQLNNLQNQALEEFEKAKTLEDLERLRKKYLGRKGELTLLLGQIKDLPVSEQPKIGQLFNKVKKEIEERLTLQCHPEPAKALASLRPSSPWLRETADDGAKAGEGSPGKGEEWIDPTQPGIRPQEGHLHLVTQAIREIEDIFKRIGFIRRRYPEVEWDWYAFEALNMAKGHPARDEWETFFLEAKEHSSFGRMLLTPHTSSGQAREMERTKPPIRMMNISKCYRRQIDISHVPMFHQFEGLVIDKGITLTHLRGVIEYFVKSFFGPERKIRLRPFHFQFTEPSLEIDVSCGLCQGRGCRSCKGGWMELAGAGMVHPNVLKAGKIDRKKYTGFAFGWGVERSYLMKQDLKIPDLRMLYQNDLRFLEQF